MNSTTKVLKKMGLAGVDKKAIEKWIENSYDWRVGMQSRTSTKNDIRWLWGANSFLYEAENILSEIIKK